MVSGVNGGLLVNIKVEMWVSSEWVSGGVLSVVIHLFTLFSSPFTHQPTDQILTRMSGMLDLSREENAKHLLPR